MKPSATTTAAPLPSAAVRGLNGRRRRCVWTASIRARGGGAPACHNN